KAELLTLPSLSLLMDNMHPAEPDVLYKAKKFVMTAIAKRFESELYSHYQQNTLFGPYKYNADDVAHRQLKNTILSYLLSTKSDQAIELALTQYHKANNMTDKMAALGGLANVEGNERVEALMDFYSTWNTNPLVVNKWLT